MAGRQMAYLGGGAMRRKEIMAKKHRISGGMRREKRSIIESWRGGDIVMWLILPASMALASAAWRHVVSASNGVNMAAY